jgi:hypothetical protein
LLPVIGNCHKNSALKVKWYQFVTMVEEVQILSERATMPRYMHNAFLVMLDVAISDDLLNFGKGTGPLSYEIIKPLHEDALV